MRSDLVRRAQSGDGEAFETLIRPAYDRLFAVADRILRDRYAAEDAVQEAVVRCWRDIRGLRDPDRLDAWLHRLLVRSCYRAAKKERRRQITEIPLAFDHDGPVPDALDSIGMRDQLERGFARLPADHRTILVLAYYADLSSADLSVALGVPLGTAKSRLNRATGALRAALDADERAASLATGRTA